MSHWQTGYRITPSKIIQRLCLFTRIPCSTIIIIMLQILWFLQIDRYAFMVSTVVGLRMYDARLFFLSAS